MYTYFKTILLLCMACLMMPGVQAQYPYLKNAFEAYNDSLFEKALEMRQKNDDVEALNYLDRINTGVPYYATILDMKINIHRKMLNYPEMEKLSGTLRSLGGGHVRRANITDAYLAQRNADFGKALELLDRNLETAPHTDYMSLLWKAMVLYKAERYDEAVPVLEKFVLDCFSYAEGHWYLGECYLRQGRISEALLAYATGAMFATSANIDDFGRRLNQLGDVDNEVLKFFGAAAAKNTFTASDKLLVSKVALNSQLKLDIDLPLSWLKQLKLIVEENNVKDAKDISHQLYLNFFQQHLIPDLQLYPFIIYYGKNDKVTAFINDSKKYKATVTAARSVLVREGLMISGTRILDAAERAGKDKVQHMVYYHNNLETEGFREIFQEVPVSVPDLFQEKFQGKMLEYMDGYLRREHDVTTGNATLYYYGSEQVHKKWVYSAPKDYRFFAYTSNGIKIMDEQYRDGQLTDLLHYYPTGQLYRHTERDSDGYKNVFYYPHGPEKLINIVRMPGYDMDTLITRYDINDSLKELVVRDNKNELILKHMYMGDTRYEYKYYTDNNMQMRMYRKGQLLFERKTDGKGVLEEKEYYVNGQLKKELVQYKDVFTEQDLKLYRKDGSLYGTVNYHGGKLNSGYMLSPGGDTLWMAFRQQDKDALKVYDEMGFLDYTIQLGFDGSLFPEMNYYYANGKIKEYRTRDANEKDKLFTEVEERFLSGNPKVAIEVLEGTGNMLTRYYYANGNVRAEYLTFDNESLEEVKFFYINGLPDFSGQRDKYFGYYGDIYSYGRDGRVSQINSKENECLVTHQSFVNGRLHYQKTLGKGTDTLILYDRSGQQKGYRVYRNGVLYGKSEMFYKSGAPEEVVFYKENGEKDSIASYYPNGVIRRTVKYDHAGRAQETGYEVSGILSNYTVSGNGEDTKTYVFAGGLKLMVSKKEQHLDEMAVIQDKDTLFYAQLHNQGLVQAIWRNEKNVLESRPVAPGDKMLSIYHTNGKKALSLPLDKYIISGDMVLYYKSGIPAVKSQWKYNMLHGGHSWYNAAGKLIEEQFYEYGRASKSYKFWDDAGKLLIEGINYGTPSEVWKYWDAKSRQMVEEDLVN